MKSVGLETLRRIMDCAVYLPFRDRIQNGNYSRTPPLGATLLSRLHSEMPVPRSPLGRQVAIECQLRIWISAASFPANTT